MRKDITTNIISNTSRSKILVECKVMGEYLKKIFPEEQIIELIHNFIELKRENIDIGKRVFFSQKLKNDVIQINSYTKGQCKYLLKYIEKIEEICKVENIENISQITFLKDLNCFCENLNQQILNIENIYTKRLLIVHGTFLVVTISIFGLATILNRDYLAWIGTMIIVIWTQFKLHKKTINKDDDSVYNYVFSSFYIKIRRILSCKEIIKQKITLRLKEISNLEDVEYLKTLNPFEFEILVGKTLEYFGYKSRVTKKTGDKGVDIWIEKDGKRSIVQCKRINGKIGTPVIRDFIGTMQMNQVLSGYIVTTNTFSTDSLLLVEDCKYNIMLIDLDGIISMIQLMNNEDKNKKIEDVLEESKSRIWLECCKNHQRKRDNQKKYGYKKYRRY